MSEEIVRFTFNRNERVKSKKQIDALFANGQSFIAYPLRVSYNKYESNDEATYPVSILVSVSKKKFKRAVKRNRIKRLIREAYRLNKSILRYEDLPPNLKIDIAFIYIKNELSEFQDIEKAMIKALKILVNSFVVEE